MRNVFKVSGNTCLTNWAINPCLALRDAGASYTRAARCEYIQKYLKNRLKHGDHDFEYDKRIDFGDPVEENDWDE